MLQISAASETVTLPLQEFEELKAQVRELQLQVQQLLGERTPERSASEEPAEDATAIAEPSPEPEASADVVDSGGGRHLSLPDISLIAHGLGKLSTDSRDSGRDRLRLREAELAVQGYVFPNVKADAYLAVSPEEEAAMQVEEAYLTYLGAAPGLNAFIGEKHVPFGRTNQLHPHSLLYARQPLALANLVSEESLIGEGLQASYLIPTGSSLFGQIDVGLWTRSGHSHEHEDDHAEPADFGFSEIVSREGSGLTDRFHTARLWLGHPIGESAELEFGGSYARGDSEGFISGRPSDATLTGLDLTYRRFWEGNRRLLLRAETVRRKETTESDSSAASGYYLFGNYRPTRYSSIGLLYDWSEFPQLPSVHESALSLILTKQFSEQYYLRLQASHGSRPGDRSYNEMLLQWVWGVGPHTHDLE